MDDASRLIAIEEIKQLKARYFRAIDRKDWPLLKSVFTDNVLLDYRAAATDPSGNNLVPDSTGEILQGNAAAVANIESSLSGISTVHHGHMPEIEILSETEATGLWAMSDILGFPAGGPVTKMLGYGHYEERYVRASEGWKIASLKLTRLRIETD